MYIAPLSQALHLNSLICSYILFIIIIGGILVLYIYIYITKLASNEIFLPSNKIHRKVGRAKDLSAPRCKNFGMSIVIWEGFIIMQMK